MPFAWERRSRLSAAGITRTPAVGSSRGGLLESACAIVPWLVWVPTVAERLGESIERKAGPFVGQGICAPCKKEIGQWECLWRQRGLLELCQRFPKFSEPRAGRASIPLKRHCSLTTRLLLGSFCSRHMCCLQWAQIVLRPHKKVVRQRAELLRDEAALVIYVWHHGTAVWAY